MRTDDHWFKIFSRDIRLTRVLITHIGEIDKPIATVILRVIGTPPVTPPEAFPPIVEVAVSEPEMLGLLRLFKEGAWFTTSYDASFEFGSFAFQVADGQTEHTFRANREGSIRLFEEMRDRLGESPDARTALETNVGRIRPTS